MVILKTPDMGQVNTLGILRMVFEFAAGCLLYKTAVNAAAPHIWTLVLGLAVT
jgi:peptidoglycan/LPS O-acetylase OafA/YrhL